MKKILWCFLLVFSLLSCSDETSSDMGVNSSTGGGDGQGGSLATFALKGDYLYVVDDFSLNVFNIVEEGNPVKVNRVPVGFQIETLFSYRDYLYIGSTMGMFIYDITNPELPVQLSRVVHFTACDPVIANDTMAYVTLHSNFTCGNDINVLEIYDVKNTTQPILISRRNLTSPKGLGLFENYLIVCDDEIKVFDVSDPKNSMLVTSVNEFAFDVIIRQNLLIAIGDGGLYQYRLLKDSNNQLKLDPLSTIDI